MKQLLAVHILLLGMLRYHAWTASYNASLAGDYSYSALSDEEWIAIKLYRDKH
jgi:hypothetical protein